MVNQVTNLKSIEKNKHFKYVYQNETYIRKFLFKTFYADSLEDHGRYAIITNRRLGNAVKRNKLRRQIKESLIKNIGCLKTNLDIVIICKSSIINQSFNKINNEVKKLIDSLNSNNDDSKKNNNNSDKSLSDVCISAVGSKMSFSS